MRLTSELETTALTCGTDNINTVALPVVAENTRRNIALAAQICSELLRIGKLCGMKIEKTAVLDGFRLFKVQTQMDILKASDPNGCTKAVIKELGLTTSTTYRTLVRIKTLGSVAD